MNLMRTLSLFMKKSFVGEKLLAELGVMDSNVLKEEKPAIIEIPKVLPPIGHKKAPSPPPNYTNAVHQPSYIDVHPFAPNPDDPNVAAIPQELRDDVDNQSSPIPNSNWFPGLPRPPPGVFIQIPQNRSRAERIRYLNDFNRFHAYMTVNHLLLFLGLQLQWRLLTSRWFHSGPGR